MESKQIEQIETERDGTVILESSASLGEKQDFQYIYWSFTYNGYDLEQIERLESILRHECDWYVFQEEQGLLTGNKHLQGTLKLKYKKRLTQLKVWNREIHWEFTRRVNKALLYATKEESRCGRQWIYGIMLQVTQKQQLLNKMYMDVVWKPWQQTVIDICESPWNARTINWFYEKKGNVGKTYLCKYLNLKYDAVLGTGKTDNVFHQIIKYSEKNNNWPTVVVLDLPRTQETYINYGCIEQIKNGFFYSGKYEGGVANFLPPHVFCFANYKPNTDALSMDRWSLFEI